MTAVAGLCRKIVKCFACTWSPEIVRDVSTSLDMTNLRNLTLVCFCAIGSAFAQTPPPPPAASERSIVYTTHDSNAIANYEPNPRVVKAMVDPR